MSSDYYIPFEIQSEIIKRLPVKSVVRCRSVSKLWKSLIHSSEFISSYHSCKTQQRQYHLFIGYKLAKEQKKYVSIVDDDTFPNQLNSSLTVPQPVRLLYYIATLTSVSGLLCFHGRGWPDVKGGNNIAVLWNPSVRKTVSITISNPLLRPNGHTYIGFGVCPITSTDPKLVRINTIGLPAVLNWEVEVFTLSARVWKTLSNIPPDFTTRHLTCDCVFVEGVIYWRAYDTRSEFIISFDLMSDEFGQVPLPGWSARMKKSKIAKVYDSLGLFRQYNSEDRTMFCDAWIMKEKSFTKMFSIKAPDTWGVFYRVLEVRFNGEVIIQNTDHTYSTVLEAYEPSSGRSSGLGINGPFDYVSVNSFMETLLLLDESNSIIL